MKEELGAKERGQGAESPVSARSRRRVTNSAAVRVQPEGPRLSNRPSVGSEGMWQEGHPGQNKICHLARSCSTQARPWFRIHQAGQRDTWRGGPTGRAPSETSPTVCGLPRIGTRLGPQLQLGRWGEGGAGTHRPVCSNGVSTQKGPRPPDSSGVGLPGGGSWGRMFMERKGKEVALTVAWSLVVEPGWRGSPQGGEGPRVRSLGSAVRSQGALEVLSP